MANFGHGGNLKEIQRNFNLEHVDIIDFSANINPIGVSKNVVNSIFNGIYEIEAYPDITYFELKQVISEFENKKNTNLGRVNNFFVKSCRCHIEKNDIILGNGAAEVLFNLVRAINPKEALIMAPTFSEYEEALRSVDCNVHIYNLKEENNFNINEEILDCINNNLDIIFICNPNNPTGAITQKDILEKILIKSYENEVKVIIDESFLDFLYEDMSMVEYLEEYKNLIIVKSLTKVYALPGLRIGYGLCKDKILNDKIEKSSPAWNINILAEIATKTALKDEEYIKKSLKFIHNEKKYLYNELVKIKKIKVYNPSVNFILFRINVNMDLKKELLERGILIRDCSNYRNLNQGFYRIAVRTHDENIKFINELNNIFNDFKC